MSRLLLIDFHDSYTFNVRELVERALGTRPDVLPFDAPGLDTTLLAGYDALLLSPGPGDPRRPADVGTVPGLVAASSLPVLGVCLGHQILALLSGAQVRHVPPRHGHVSRLRHRGTGLFAGLPPGLAAVRYHSLAVLEPLPATLRADAWAEDGTLMAFHATERPWWGVQHHPESVCSEGGAELIRAWAEAAGITAGTSPGTPAGPSSRTCAAPPARASGPEPAPSPPEPAQQPASAPVSPGAPSLLWREIPPPGDLAAAHELLCGDRPASFWLDSALVAAGRSRWSFLGFPGDGEVLACHAGRVEVQDEHGTVTATEPPGALRALRSRLPREPAAPPSRPAPPFPLRGGFVGYLGYEARRELGLSARTAPDGPEALWLRASRYLAVDHAEGRAWLAAEASPDAATASAWLDQAGALLARAGAAPALPLPPALLDAARRAATPVDDAATYQARVRRAQEHLISGDSYEVCLTTAAQVPFAASSAQVREVYRRQRAANPAPYAALLVGAGTAVLSSSPERFLRVGPEGAVETKPIKGTARRDADPATDQALARSLRTDPKTRAELLMIVDLLRNDLARACRPGSVAVPELMAVESYETVHQLLSRITGQLPPGGSALDLVAATFPGGSMTGAPKERTMAIIDALEDRPRGVYSGALGYVSADGAADLSIVIRTAVVHEGTLTVGAGGAVVLASTPEGEHEEMLLKLRAPLAWAFTGEAGTPAR